MKINSKKSALILLMILTFSLVESCGYLLTKRVDKIEKGVPQYFYGEYFCPIKNISLHLYPPDKFEISKHDFFADMINIELLDSGWFKLKDNKIILYISEKSDTGIVSIIDDEILNTIDMPYMKSGEKFLCWTKFHNNGERKSNGGWVNGHKQGSWQYWDSLGVFQYRINFDTINGQPVDTIYTN